MFVPPRSIMPQGPAQAYKTYQMAMPVATHWVRATCAEVDCGAYLNGWRVRVEDLTPELVHTAKRSGRKFTEHHIADGETWLVFPPGQPCFKTSQHMRPVGKPPLFLVRDGDWRGNPYGTRPRQHTRAEFWVEDFAEHQDRLARQIQKG